MSDSDGASLSDLWKILKDSSDDYSREETVLSICKSYSFSTVLHNIHEKVVNCRCTPVCEINLACTFLRYCSDDYLKSSDFDEIVDSKYELTREANHGGFNYLLNIESHSDIGEFADREFYDFTEDDFPKAAVRAIGVFSFFTLLFKKLSPADFLSPEQFLDLSSRLITKAAAHTTTGPWTNASSRQGALGLLGSLSLCCSCANTSELLVWESLSKSEAREKQPRHVYSIFGKILSQNESRLLKNTWPKNPFFQSAFCWCLRQIKHPHLSVYLDQILSPVLLFVDDFISNHKILGLKCLYHIMENVSNEELRWYNRHAVIFDALKHQLYTQEVTVLEHTLTCLLSILKVIEKVPCNSDYNHYDEIFELTLYNSEIENKLAFRRIYTRFIPQFIELMGINCVRHMKILLRIIESYLEIYDKPFETARLNILCTLEKMIQVAWPRVETHIDFIVKILLKLLYDVIVEDVMIISTPVKKQLVKKTLEILCHLKKLNAYRIKELLSAVNGKVDVDEFQLAVQSVLDSNLEEK